MMTNSLTTDVAAEHRRVLLQNAENHRRAKAARRPAPASRLTIRVRPVRPEDGPLLEAIFAGLSPGSRLARFLYPKTTLSEAELRDLADIDHHDHEAFIALTRLGAEPLGVARFIRNRQDPTSAEVAIAVVDEWQERGVGSMLTARLTARAVQEDVAQFTALAARDNLRARRLLAKAGVVSIAAYEHGAVCYRVTLPARRAPKHQQHRGAPPWRPRPRTT